MSGIKKGGVKAGQDQNHLSKQIGIGGQSNSTTDGKVHATAQFDVWRSSKGLSNFKDMPRDDFANREIFREFGYFLAFDATKKIKIKKDDPLQGPLMMQTARQYFSNWVVKVTEKKGGCQATVEFFSDFPPIKEKNPFWVTSIRHDITQLMTKDCIRKGIPVTIRCQGVGKAQMIMLGQYFINLGKSISYWFNLSNWLFLSYWLNY